AFLAGGCEQILEATGMPDAPSGGAANLIVTIAGSRDAVSYTANQSYLAPARTMLATNSAFTGYKLYVSPNENGSEATEYPSDTGSFQVTLDNGTYYVSAAGFTGDKPSARTGTLANTSINWRKVTVDGAQNEVELTLAPYMDPDIYGTLHYSLSWEGVGQIPAWAELLVELYTDDDDTWNPIPISLMNETVTAGSGQGIITLLRRETGLVQQSGELSLPPGEYRLTTTVAMDSPYPPVSRTDIAHIFSNLTTPAAFHYGSGDLIVTNAGTDAGSGFITSFTFSQTPGAASSIGSTPGHDGTRLIMVTVPSGTDLTSLTPVVECAPGARITSPAPSPGPDGKPSWPPGDYSKPTSWTATGLNGVTQQYTVVVSEPANDECMITDFAFNETGLTRLPVIDQTNCTIEVIVPYGTGSSYQNYNLTPVISWVGKEIKLIDDSSEIPWSGGKVQFGSSPSRQFRVYAQNGASKTYTATITEAASNEAEITAFVFDGYPDYPGTVTQPGGTEGSISVTLPYGSNLSSLKPLITYKGNISPASGAEQNFSMPKSVVYTVTSQDGATTKTYPVTVATTAPNLGIFDFVITNVPRAKVVIGTKPRQDGKIPIILSVPYKTAPLTTDGSMTDLKRLIPRITLSDPVNATISPNPDGTSDVIAFNNQNDYQEAVYTVSTTGTPTVSQAYVVIVARDIDHYYVSASGNDMDPDQYNGSEQAPFRTLAYAVYQAVKNEVDHIYVIGTLNDASEGGAWEDTSATTTGTSDTFQPSGAPSVAGGDSVFNINGAGRDGNAAWPIYITGIGSNAALQGASGKRVISITGGAHITFENIAIQNGGGTSYAGNGGGMYIGGGSVVKWKSGVISGNTAVSGGGVYVDNSDFQLLAGTITNNMANDSTIGGTTVKRADFENNAIGASSIPGGGGVYVYGENGLFWLAEGSIYKNTTNGSGGGVLVNGSVIPDNPKTDGSDTPLNFMMSAGTIEGNVSKGAVWPHGGGGVFVAKGVFEMIDGHITGNQASRQGGGVFVWSRSLFDMYGNSSVTGNKGTGSSTAICNRGITTMRGKAQADKVYVWNYAKGSWNNGSGDEFTMMEGAGTSDVELGFADDPKDNRNYINLVSADGLFTGTGPITTIGLESHLTSTGAFDQTATIDGDWRGTYLIKNNGNTILPGIVKRFPLSNFIYGLNTISLSLYKLDEHGRLIKR
ncbi:MAG: DUF5018 domain-containing protein, partial [Treponema sp.]|nr:DUF5018 domain-containing protein [Treponema sp.]